MGKPKCVTLHLVRRFSLLISVTLLFLFLDAVQIAGGSTGSTSKKPCDLLSAKSISRELGNGSWPMTSSRKWTKNEMDLISPGYRKLGRNGIVKTAYICTWTNGALSDGVNVNIAVLQFAGPITRKDALRLDPLAHDEEPMSGVGDWALFNSLTKDVEFGINNEVITVEGPAAWPRNEIAEMKSLGRLAARKAR